MHLFLFEKKKKTHKIKKKKKIFLYTDPLELEEVLLYPFFFLEYLKNGAFFLF